MALYSYGLHSYCLCKPKNVVQDCCRAAQYYRNRFGCGCLAVPASLCYLYRCPHTGTPSVERPSAPVPISVEMTKTWHCLVHYDNSHAVDWAFTGADQAITISARTIDGPELRVGRSYVWRQARRPLSVHWRRPLDSTTPSSVEVAITNMPW